MEPDRLGLLAEDAERAAWWVRKLAKERGISLSDLGPMSGVNRSTMYSLLREAPCTLRTLTYVAATLGVRARDLLADIPEGPEALEHRSRRVRKAAIGVWDGQGGSGTGPEGHSGR